MIIQTEICHIDQSRVIIKVVGWEKDSIVGTAHAEHKSVEKAEDLAIERLKTRLEGNEFNESFDESNNIKNLDNKNQAIKSKEKIIQEPNYTIKNKNNTNMKPELKDKSPIDWSKELSLIEIELKRLGWNIDQENEYLKEEYGINNRNKITIYEDLTDYLDKLKSINDTDSKSSDLKTYRTELIDCSNKLLLELGWDSKKGRQFLREKMNKDSRDKLTEKELSDFVNLLKMQIQ